MDLALEQASQSVATMAALRSPISVTAIPAARCSVTAAVTSMSYAILKSVYVLYSLHNLWHFKFFLVVRAKWGFPFFS